LRLAAHFFGAKKAQIGKERCACPSKTLRATREVRSCRSSA
jgi:hypothetical protein